MEEVKADIENDSEWIEKNLPSLLDYKSGEKVRMVLGLEAVLESAKSNDISPLVAELSHVVSKKGLM
jgi:hypothetical protein